MERQTDEQIERQACEKDGRTYLERGFGKGWEDKLRERLMRRNYGQIKRQACVKDRKMNLAIFRLIRSISRISRSFELSDFCYFASMRNKRNYTFFRSRTKRNFRFEPKTTAQPITNLRNADPEKLFRLHKVIIIKASRFEDLAFMAERQIKKYNFPTVKIINTSFIPVITSIQCRAKFQ
jgi:hypothetical protein